MSVRIRDRITVALMALSLGGAMLLPLILPEGPAWHVLAFSAGLAMGAATFQLWGRNRQSRRPSNGVARPSPPREAVAR